MRYQGKSVLLAVGITAAGALTLSACSGSASDVSSTSATPTASSATPVTPSPTQTSAIPTQTPVVSGKPLNPSASSFKLTGASKINVTSGAIEGLVANPSLVTAQGQTASGAFKLTMKVNSSGTVTSANLTIGKNTYKSVGSSGAVEFGDAPPGVAVGTTKAIPVTQNGGNGTLNLTFTLTTKG